jgi:acyl-CoA thioester hydrolase
MALTRVEMERRANYAHVRTISTRWLDNDVYGHVNNVQYYAFFDTVINSWLIEEGALDISRSTVIGLCAESHCTFHNALAFPDTVDAALRVAQIGRSSVRYEIGLFRGQAEEPAATGWFVHVFVDRKTRQPIEIAQRIRTVLELLLVRDGSPSVNVD